MVMRPETVDPPSIAAEPGRFRDQRASDLPPHKHKTRTIEASPRGWGIRPVIALLPQKTHRDELRQSNWSATASLVERAQDGDRDAFGALVEQFHRTVYAVCLGRLGNPSEAMELTQDVFLHVMKRLDQLREPERFAGWIRQVAVRMAINRATRRVPPSSVETEILEGASGSIRRDDPLDSLINLERASKLWSGLNRLKTLDRETLVSFYIHGHSLAEMAKTLDAPIGTIKRRLHTARKRLKAELQSVTPDAEEWVDGACETAEEEAFELAC